MGFGGREVQEESIYVHLWLIQLTVQEKLTEHCKAIILQLKKIFLKKEYFTRPGSVIWNKPSLKPSQPTIDKLHSMLSTFEVSLFSMKKKKRFLSTYPELS